MIVANDFDRRHAIHSRQNDVDDDEVHQRLAHRRHDGRCNCAEFGDDLLEQRLELLRVLGPEPWRVAYVEPSEPLILSVTNVSNPPDRDEKAALIAKTPIIERLWRICIARVLMRAELE